MFRISQTSLTTVPFASPVEGNRRSGAAIRMQNALKNASVVAGGGVSRTGVSLLGMPVYKGENTEEEEEEDEEEIISMLNIRMSRTPIEGSPPKQ